ncbi:MAG TPA: NAD-dependent epimerase/dehydratase family protein [Chitinophagaceae bacterium]|nr:NAD-dependent epimerase/dehydratase family protein [Chitinophagaceae bacterium]
MVDYTDKIRNKKVLVTGGFGFVGHNLVKSLLHDYGCEVTVVDNCVNSSPAVLGKDFEKIEFHQISVLETEKLIPLMTRVNYIFHLACKQISASGKEALDDLRVNAESTLNMLEYIKHNNLPKLERFVYTSSCSVYGSSNKLPTSEREPTFVLSNYAATKLLGENYTLIYNKNYYLPTSSVRYSNVYGYGQSPRNPYCGVLGIFVHNSLTGQALSVFGDGEQTRDYTFIADAVRATILAAVHPKALGEVFNVGTGVETSVNQLAEIIAEHTGDVEIKHVPERDIDNIRRRCIDIEKIRQRLGWAPEFNVKRGIDETLKWYKTTL